jgi:pSer/pThr/pTyr-binding forkhead associated (FHA) protein
MAQKICPNCSAAQPGEYQFCAECGSRLPEPKVENTTEKATPQRVAKTVSWSLVHLSRAGGANVPYSVPAEGLEIGAQGCDIVFPEDRTVSPRHATVTVAVTGLQIDDAGSINGIFLKIPQEHTLVEGDVFVCGDSVFRFSSESSLITPEDFKLFAAPDEVCPKATITRIMTGGADAQVFPVIQATMSIGREGCDICCPEDKYMSRSHAFLEVVGKDLVLKDKQSRNGSYIKTSGQVNAVEGDVVLIGRQILRVEAKPL